MLFLQTGLRVSELVNLTIQDVDFISKEITMRQGKGDRVVPLVGQAHVALKACLGSEKQTQNMTKSLLRAMERPWM